MRRTGWLAGGLIAAVMLAGCSVNVGVELSATASGTAAPPSATPDVYATSVQKTLAALADEATALAEATQTPSPTPTGEPAPTSAPTRTPRPATTAPRATTRPPTTAPPSATPEPTAAAGEVSVVRFEASPSTIDPGDDITLSWEVVGSPVTLYRMMPTGQFGTFWELDAPQGEMTLPTDPGVRNQVTFALYAGEEGPAGATVSVTVRCPTTWFFTPAPDECAQWDAVQGAGAVQRFEGGQMIWFGPEDRIYVLYDDGQSPQVDVVSDPWAEGMPESDPDIVPPAGLYQPVRGFGAVWRGEGGTWGVRERLGWALAPEAAITTAYQCNSAPKYNTCYLQGAGGAIIRLDPERSGWGVIPGAAPAP